PHDVILESSAVREVAAQDALGRRAQLAKCPIAAGVVHRCTCFQAMDAQCSECVLECLAGCRHEHSGAPEAIVGGETPFSCLERRADRPDLDQSDRTRVFLRTDSKAYVTASIALRPANERPERIDRRWRFSDIASHAWTRQVLDQGRRIAHTDNLQ